MIIFLQTILQITHINQLLVSQVDCVPPTTHMRWQHAIKPGRNGQK